MPSGAYGVVRIKGDTAHKYAVLFHRGHLNENNLTEAIFATTLSDRGLRNMVRVDGVQLHPNAPHPVLIISMEKGITVHELLRTAPERINPRKLLRDITTAAFDLHTNNLCHNDIKPSNMIYCEAINKYKLIDFGSVRQIGSKAMVGFAYAFAHPKPPFLY